MLNGYNPLNWYWQASDGRVYGSKAQAIVASEDATFAAWLKEGWVATPWPKDTDGKESDDELQAVLAPYGLALPKPAKS